MYCYRLFVKALDYNACTILAVVKLFEFDE